MSADSKSTKELAAKYEGQSKPTMMNVNYKAPTGKEDTWESQAHTGGPACYSCCGPKCALSLVGIVVVAIVCCAYVSQKGTCCSICYWPF